MKALIVGAGLAGLTCARELLHKGIDVTILEKSDGVGGRVRTDTVDGFLLDQGFQVLFTSYPAARRHLDYQQLRLCLLDPSAIIAKGSHRYLLTDPIRDPGGALNVALSPIITLPDKLRTALLAMRLRFQTIDQVLAGRDITTQAFLHRRGFSNSYINNFVRPFFGGVFLERSLNTSAKCFKFDFKMLTQGHASIPALGIGQIAAQLADPLILQNRIRLNSPVESLLKSSEGRVSGVRLATGETLYADAVVLSVPAPVAHSLSGLPTPRRWVSTLNLYWASTQQIYNTRKIVLNANPRPFINTAVQISNISPDYAPPGRHLLTATVLGLPDQDDDTLFQRGMADLRRMFRGDTHALSALATYRPLKLYRIPYSQFAQPPGIHPHLPDNTTPIPNLYFAAEFTEASSQNAAMISGEKAAALIATYLHPTYSS